MRLLSTGHYYRGGRGGLSYTPFDSKFSKSKLPDDFGVEKTKANARIPPPIK